jgi:hypothetical protein
MGPDEALALAAEVRGELRKLSWDECRQLMKAVSTRTFHGRDGTDYQRKLKLFGMPGSGMTFASWYESAAAG